MLYHDKLVGEDISIKIDKIKYNFENMEENMKEKFPLRFIVATFAWSWLIWLPLVLAGLEIIVINKEVFASITTPISILAAFGPAFGEEIFFLFLKNVLDLGLVLVF